MKSAAIRKLRQKLAADEPVYGLWVTLESGSITEMAVALGLDWVVVDAEHGHLDWRDVLEHIRAAVRSDTVVLVRVAELNGGLIKRALDIGADGVVVPWVEEVEQLRQAVAWAHYPPAGRRGIGAERATGWGQSFAEHVEEAGENVLVVPIIESVRGGRNIRDLLEVPGVDIFYFGPADYSSTAGYPGQWEGPGVAEEILAAKDAIRSRGKHCGVVATSNENLVERREQGFRMLAVGLDSGLLLRCLHSGLAAVGRDRKMGPGLEPMAAPSTPGPETASSPAAAAPGGPEVVTAAGSGIRTEVIPGIVFEALVGSHNGARNLVTGLSTFAPGAHLGYHEHPYTETLTLLSGEAIIEVEGRMYALEEFDSMAVPAGLAHAATNPSRGEAARFHAAVPTDQMSRIPVDRFFSRRRMPAGAVGRPGAEWVVRHRSAPRRQDGPGISCIDLFDGDLVPGLQIAAVLGTFEPGARCQPHRHEVDKSVIAVQGTALCTVEGRKHPLAAGAAALVPSGRLHCIANQTVEAAAAIWVCAGPSAAPTVPDDGTAATAGDDTP